MTEDRRHLVRNWIDALRTGWSDAKVVRRERDRVRLGVDGADLARRQFRWAEAEAGYRLYLTRRPRDTAIVVRLARTLTSAGKIAEAQAVLAAALYSRPDSPALKRATEALASVAAVVEGTDIAALHGFPMLEAPRLDTMTAGTVLRADEGVKLYPEAEAWLEYALSTTGAAAVYADHWCLTAAGEPVLFGGAHVQDLMTVPQAPVMVLFSAETAAAVAGLDLRRALIAAFAHGPVVHVPLLLAEAWEARSAAPEASRAVQEPPARILVVVPTRDEGRMLQTMLDSLRATAHRADLLDVVVVDNGSRDPLTLNLMAEWQAYGVADVLRIDEPFNWSDLNNRAVMGRTQDILLFVNNDMVMKTRGWDERLRVHVSMAEIGAVGARLLYPAGNIQHAGLALGVAGVDGEPLGPLHEGLGAGAEDAGPLDRWGRNRPAAAVTGAFLAVRREVFDDLGGFDAENFAVSCNDVDFCLRVRERGLTVLYAADIELTHDESHTRGHDDDPVRQARAEREKSALIRIWGEDARRDPARNPHWVALGTRIFHGVRQPDRQMVLAEIARGGGAWRTRRRD